MPTRSGWLVLVGAVASVTAARAFGLLELLVLGVAGVVLVLVAVVWCRVASADLRVDRRNEPATPTVGRPARIDLHGRATGRRVGVVDLEDPVEGTVGVRMTVGPFGPGARAQLGYRLPTRQRGPLHIGPLTAVVSDPFGLARRRVALAPATVVTVVPAVEVLDGGPAGAGRRAPQRGAGRPLLGSDAADDPATLRPYVVGDDLRRVHWTSSARVGELVVRREEDRRQGRATVVLDCDASAMDADAFEQAVSAAASLVHAAAEAGDAVRLVTTDPADRARDAGPVDGRRHEATLLHRLALVGQHPPPGADDATPMAATAPAGADPDGSADAVVLLSGPVPSQPAGPRTTRVAFADAPVDGVLTVGPGDRFADRWRSR